MESSSLLKNQIDNLKSFQNIVWNPEGSKAYLDHFPSSGILLKWNGEIIPAINEVCEKYLNAIDFMDEITISNLVELIQEIIDLKEELIILISNNSQNNHNIFIKNFNLLYENINKLAKTSIYLDSTKAGSSLEKLIKFISKPLGINAEYYINEINKMDMVSKYSLPDIFVNLYNKTQDGTYTPELLNEIGIPTVSQMQKKLYEAEKLLEEKGKRIQNKENELKIKEKEVLIRIESAKNQSTIKEFKRKADGLKVYIYILNALIVFLFIVIISIFMQKYYSQPEINSKIIYSIGLIIAISSLMAFLIKEKNILSNQYHNYIKCHTEMVALSTYIVDIEKIKSEDLKIRLAEKYFTGYLPIEKEINSNAISSDAINQIISLIKESQKK
ncbi:hypothetical protein A1E89_RS10745 [Acinetobacter baumannii]|uniref:hypothetical protein n=1 Tax=Acinetobacter TaxID=469 RepID=UPI000405B91D|nr:MULTISPECIES: hypothetical protein [Acinetobacter]EHU1907391.1 hypothetical protein [Acinetobacter baumannii]KAF6701249.1 hypothetical protein G9371_16675 [Acinetobacter sp. EKM10A]KRI32586.1 hypothetical protein APB98_04175 [Acinetobacter baumannii]MDN8286602.1 hypothetical protein [Acinetobacter baumannii]MDN8364627.1 hypothetical protein [Acinetobacter baumannii]